MAWLEFRLVDVRTRYFHKDQVVQKQNASIALPFWRLSNEFIKKFILTSRTYWLVWRVHSVWTRGFSEIIWTFEICTVERQNSKAITELLSRTHGWSQFEHKKNCNYEGCSVGFNCSNGRTIEDKQSCSVGPLQLVDCGTLVESERDIYPSDCHLKNLCFQ